MDQQSTTHTYHITYKTHTTQHKTQHIHTQLHSARTTKKHANLTLHLHTNHTPRVLRSHTIHLYTSHQTSTAHSKSKLHTTKCSRVPIWTHTTRCASTSTIKNRQHARITNYELWIQTLAFHSNLDLLDLLPPTSHLLHRFPLRVTLSCSAHAHSCFVAVHPVPSASVCSRPNQLKIGNRR